MRKKIVKNHVQDLKTLNPSIIKSNKIEKAPNDALEKFFNLSIDFMCIANTEGYFIKVNKTFMEVLGYDEVTILKNKFLEFVHPDDIAITLNEINKLTTGAVTLNFENRYRKINGDYVILNWNTMPDVETGMLYASARDMTLFYKDQNIENENIKLKAQELITIALIKRVLPESLAKRMLAGEDFIADYYPQTSILFLDICKFTFLTEKMPAYVVLSLLEIIFSRFDKILKKYNCEMIKTIGDGLLAISGAPIFEKNHAENILMAAFELMEPIELSKNITEYFPKDAEFKIRIGIHIGPVVGCVLKGNHMHWDIFSKAVNIAAKMEQYSLPGHIQVSSDFVKHLKDRIALSKVDLNLNFERRGEIGIKNFGMTQTYFISKVV